MADIEFRLLGSVEVRRQGQQLAVSGSKSRALLAMLLLHAGETVGRDRLIDALWGEHPPASAANALQAHVVHLRRLLDPDRSRLGIDSLLVTRPGGYSLRLTDEQLDSARFERLVADGRAMLGRDPAAASELLGQALGLWHGPALADFAFDDFAQADANRLEELRLAVLEDRLEADLALGSHARVVPELEALVTEHPLRERLAGQLMLALYRCDRTADASRVFHATRGALAQELGLEPGPALRRLHERILAHDPTLAIVAEDQELAIAAAARGRGRAAAAHNLPAELTSFVGRERELAEVSELLSRTRLLTLTGTGGSGKTRLAMRAARAAAAQYADGVWMVELGALADPGLVASSLADALRVAERSGSLLDTLKRRLRESELLIVLDNCEHLVGACAELAHELLCSCEAVRILATSREPLRVTGEVTWQVPGLEVPDAPALTVDELSAYAAIRLYAERAAAARPGFALESADAEAVALLCSRLDGIPLAIELAAARARALSAEEVLRRLDDRFGLLTGGARDALARHQTLRATIDWSHELLDRAEQVLFRRLAVFAGGWTLADAEQTCPDADLPRPAVAEVLARLVAKSLVVAEPAGPGATRYRLLEMLRDYAGERLTISGEQALVAARHFSHFLNLAEEAHLSGGSQAALETLSSQHDNLRAALAYADAHDSAGLMRLATAAEQLWLAGNLPEGWSWLQKALAREPHPTRERVRALNTAAVVATLLQSWNDARRIVDESLMLTSALGDSEGQAWALVRLGFIEVAIDNVPAAIRPLERSRDMHERLGDGLGLCRSLLFLGVARSVTAGPARARAELQRGLRIAQELGDAWGTGFGSIFLGFADFDEGRPGAAGDSFRVGVRTDALGPVRAAGLEGLAELAVGSDPRRTLQLQAAADALRERVGGRPPAWRARRSALACARAERRLSPDDARDAWEAGYRMSTAEAIAYAFAELASTSS
ncbi:MAG: BTAD domain-containing putative transcriptional regulator [Solirubrobacteraceae bacterium]